jgi:hypothetical protein
MGTSDCKLRQVLLAFDACTLNPFKKFDHKKPRLKAKLKRQLLDQPRILQLLCDLQRGQGFVINQFIPVSIQKWGRAHDEQVLEQLEALAWSNPGQIVIFVTRDHGFCAESGWRSDQSRVYICILPRRFFNKDIGQYSRLDMMYIIAIDITHFLTQGEVKYSRLYSPAAFR